MLNIIKEKNIVARKSYGKDIIFVVDKIIKNKIAILTGLTTRLQADAYIDDLEVLNKKEVEEVIKGVNERITQESNNISIQKKDIFTRTNKVIYTGRILHLDGDKRYSEKSNMYYKKMGLKAIVRNVTERNQANVVNALIDRYKPDILIVTGHDRDDKKG